MKNQIILTILAIFLASCNHAQENKNLPAMQKYFNVKGNVKEIETTTKAFTTMGERNLVSKTTFNKIGEPVETIDYDENGKVKSREPWTKASELEDKGWELVKEFDKQKRLIKSTKYNNGKIASEHYYKYDLNGKKIEDYEKIGGEKIKYKYINNLVSEEKTSYETEDGKFYWYCTKKVKYDNQSKIIEMMVQYSPVDEARNGKYTYKYDKKGSLIETIGYAGNGMIEKTTRKITYY